MLKPKRLNVHVDIDIIKEVRHKKTKPRKIIALTIGRILLLSLVPLSGLAVRAPPAKPPFDLMIITPTDFCTALQPLAAHKNAL
jgi:hypothetical protein